MEIACNLSIAFQSLQPFIIATIITFLSLIVAVRSFFKRPRKSNSSCPSTSPYKDKIKGAAPSYSCNGNSDSTVVVCGSGGAPASTSNAVAERQNGASMMEQLVPEITTHALSYLDYPSLCRLCMTNSLMRKAANDDNVWKALYHKDFTLEQDTVTPVNGWKAYYAATRAIMNVNTEFFNIIRDRSVSGMLRLWLNADYVKCVHASGKRFSGFGLGPGPGPGHMRVLSDEMYRKRDLDVFGEFNQVLFSWHRALNLQQGVDFHVIDVRARVLTDVAWVTMKTYADMSNGAFNVTNVYEFHHGRWYLVHHHSSVLLADGGMEQHIVNG